MKWFLVLALLFNATFAAAQEIPGLADKDYPYKEAVFQRHIDEDEEAEDDMKRPGIGFSVSGSTDDGTTAEITFTHSFTEEK